MTVVKRLVVVASLACLVTCAPGEPQPPKAAVRSHEVVSGGRVRIDDYYWLRHRENPAVVEYLEAENAYADAVMEHARSLQDELVREFRSRIKQTDSSAPVPDRGYLYYHRTEDGSEYPIHCRIGTEAGAEEEILLDVNALAQGHDFCSAGELRVSPTGDSMVYAVDTIGRRKYTLRFKDLRSGQHLADEITDVTGNTAWANDGRTLLYVRQDPETLRWYQVWRHVVGTDPGQDALVYEENDETFGVSVERSGSGRMVFIVSQQTLASEVRFVDADDPNGTPTVIAPRQRGVEYDVVHHGDRFFIRTNLDAPNFRLMEAPVTAPGRDGWREVIPERSDVLLQDVHAFRDFIVLSERADATRRLAMWRPGTGEAELIRFDEPAHDVWVDDNREYDSPVLRFGFTSLTTPESFYDYDTRTGEHVLVKRQEVAGYDPSEYVSERLMVPARDGVEIPLSVVRRADLRFDGSAPLLLHGYGAYGACEDPAFDPERVSLLDRGFSYAIAHVRGGEERGRWWYENGKLLAKRNTFTDFIDCARYLVENGYTSPDRLAASGRSAGGLLMGAVANMAPEMFAAIVAEVPFVDVVTTMLDASIPLTTSEFDEWGNPEDPVFYDYMLSYSPYDRVAAKAYPAMMVTAGFNDSQVQYWEPAKWVARLRALKTDDRPLVLRTDMDSGHGGASGRYEAYRERAEEFAFLLEAVARDD